jgi:hypothetical protein
VANIKKQNYGNFTGTVPPTCRGRPSISPGGIEGGFGIRAPKEPVLKRSTRIFPLRNVILICDFPYGTMTSPEPVLRLLGKPDARELFVV